MEGKILASPFRCAAQWETGQESQNSWWLLQGHRLWSELSWLNNDGIGGAMEKNWAAGMWSLDPWQGEIWMGEDVTLDLETSGCVSPDPGAMVTPGMSWMDFAICPHRAELNLLSSMGLDQSAPWRFYILISFLLHYMWLRHRFPGASFSCTDYLGGSSPEVWSPPKHMNTHRTSCCFRE